MLVNIKIHNSLWKVVHYEIKCGDQLRVLGRFENFNDAVSARKNAEDQLFGEYSYENSINR